MKTSHPSISKNELLREPQDFSLSKFKKPRIEPGQQPFDFRDLRERGLFAPCQFLCAHELRQVEIDDFGLDDYVRRLDADPVEAEILHFEGAEQRLQARRRPSPASASPAC